MPLIRKHQKLENIIFIDYASYTLFIAWFFWTMYWIFKIPDVIGQTMNKQLCHMCIINILFHVSSMNIKFLRLAFLTSFTSSINIVWLLLSSGVAMIWVFSLEDKNAAHIPNVPWDTTTWSHKVSMAKSTPIHSSLVNFPSRPCWIVPTKWTFSVYFSGLMTGILVKKVFYELWWDKWLSEKLCN